MTKVLLIALVVACICTLTVLGFWQLQRADQKQQLITLQNQQLSQKAIELNTDNDTLDSTHFKHVFMNGHFDCAHQILLDNKMHNSQPGFHVITSFRPSKTKLSILVNRGWIPMKANRAPDPAYIECSQALMKVQGIVTKFPALGFHPAGSTDSVTQNWPQIMLELDAIKLSSALGYSIVDYFLLMDQSVADGFVREWDFTPTISTQKHIAYAVQWFLLAATLCVLCVCGVWKNTNDKKQ